MIQLGSDYLNMFIEKFGSNYEIVRGSDEIRYNCPFCVDKVGKVDKKRKLYANVKKGKFYCFRCGSRGRFDLADLSNDYIYSSLVDTYESMMGNYDNCDEDDDSNVFYAKNIKIPDNSVAYRYLKNRGIDRDLIDYYDMRLGVDDLFGRILIPNITYGSNRTWTDMYSARSYINQIPKYKNPLGVRKSKSVFNLHRLEGGVCYVVEGVITAICAGKEAVALYGCSPSREQITMIVSKEFNEIYCVLDNDEAGRKGNRELSEMLNEEINRSNHRTKLYTVTMPEGIDAADIGEDKFKRYVNLNKKLYLPGVYGNLLSMF